MSGDSASASGAGWGGWKAELVGGDAVRGWWWDGAEEHLSQGRKNGKERTNEQTSPSE